jgi:ubiquinone biosynthesis monooxygenase Coq7
MRIYQGQMDVLARRRDAASQRALKLVEHMAEQEKTHLDWFNQAMVERRVRPTLWQPLWHVGAYALGAATAALGPKAAMACTVAVESVIGEHYQAQREQLAEAEDPEPVLEAAIAKFQAEEQEHHDTGLAEDAEHALAYPLLSIVVKGLTRLAIRASTPV